jgi:hypothetical protein
MDSLPDNMKKAEGKNGRCRLISWDDYAKLFPG